MVQVGQVVCSCLLEVKEEEEVVAAAVEEAVALLLVAEVVEVRFPLVGAEAACIKRKYVIYEFTD